MGKLRGFVLAASLWGVVGCASAQNDVAALQLERTIELSDVAGRIDHLALDPGRSRLAIAELGNNSVDVVDLASGAVVHRLTGLSEPQGVAFDLTGKRLVIANGGDGVVRVFDASTFAAIGTLKLGDDADNVRIDPRNGHAIVGYGNGALAVVDLDAQSVLVRASLPAHPESFQIDAKTGRVFVNAPDARTIAVVDLDHGKALDRWNLPLALWNFPLALSPSNDQLVSVFRTPPQITAFNRTSGEQLGSAGTCGDADDVFYDDRRKRIYVSCGGGGVDVFDSTASPLKRVAHVDTRSGARTALFDPVLDRLFVAARSPGGGKPAAILVFKPVG